MKATSGGLGGSGGVGGRSAAASDARMVARLKRGVRDAELDYLRTGMRDLGSHRAAYAGKTAAQVERIAAGKVKTDQGWRFNPIKVEVYKGRFILTDGRHRLTAAREAGARRILADVTVAGPRGGVKATRRMLIKVPRL